KIETITVEQSGSYFARVVVARRAGRLLPRNHPASPWNRVLSKMDIIELVAGPLAEGRALGWPWRETECRLRGALGLVASQPLTPSADDFSGALHLARQLVPEAPHSLVVAMGTTACALLCAEWPSIVRVATILEMVGTMSGEEFEWAWQRMRAPRQRRRRP